MTKYCTWIYDESEDGWDTDCGKKFWIAECGTPKEHGFKFCCFCGNALRQKVGKT